MRTAVICAEAVPGDAIQLTACSFLFYLPATPVSENLLEGEAEYVIHRKPNPYCPP